MATAPSIGRAITFMEQHLKQPVSIEQIAQAAGFSRSTLQRRFLETTQVTVGLFLRRLRIGAAAAELVSTRRRIVDIALDYQFESQQTFTRAFRDTTWLTPGEARRLKRLPDLAASSDSAQSRSGLSVPLGMRGVMIFTGQMEALTTFYHDLIGLPVLDPDPEFTQLDAGGSVLVLHPSTKRGAARQASAIEISFSTPDVERVRQELIARGVKAGRVAVFGELRICKASDPDGNILAITNRPLPRVVGV